MYSDSNAFAFVHLKIVGGTATRMRNDHAATTLLSPAPAACYAVCLTNKNGLMTNCCVLSLISTSYSVVEVKYSNLRVVSSCFSAKIEI